MDEEAEGESWSGRGGTLLMNVAEFEDVLTAQRRL